jgi:hypothetical protein
MCSTNCAFMIVCNEYALCAQICCWIAQVLLCVRQMWPRPLRCLYLPPSLHHRHAFPPLTHAHTLCTQVGDVLFCSTSRMHLRLCADQRPVQSVSTFTNHHFVSFKSLVYLITLVAHLPGATCKQSLNGVFG